MRVATAGKMRFDGDAIPSGCTSLRRIKIDAAARSSALQQRSELAEALAACRGAFISIGLMSGMSNILMLTGAFFMLEVYDRVLPSRSVPTLVGLVMLAAGLYTAQGLLDLIRGRILVRIGSRLDEALSGRVYETIVRLPLQGRQPQRRPAAAARSRQRALVPVGLGPDRAVRSAVAAGLSGHLLSVPSLYRAGRAVRRHRPRHHHDADRDHDARADAGGHRLCHDAQRRSPRPAAATPKSSPPWA